MTMLERGFKAWSERTSNLIRKELEIGLEQPFNVEKMADYLGVRLWTPQNVSGLALSDHKILQEKHWQEWYGVGLQDSEGGIVIYNPRQSLRRQRSDISHELAHFLLEHEPSKLILSESKALEQIWFRSYDQKQEDEANCLAWALLVPRDGLIRLVRRNSSISEIAASFEVSEQLARYRVNSTGIKKQLNH